MKKLLLSIIPLLLVLTCYAQTKSIRDFGAKGDGVADDTQALIKGVQGSSTLTIPAGTYNFKGRIELTALHNKTIIADKNAVMRNTVDNKGSFNITQCTHISITGGTWTYVNLPTAIGLGPEHYFSITGCQDIEVTHVHIIGSAETGFSLVNDVNVTIANNEIERCFRDGIYSHYSASLVYCGNYIHDIKDDAMSVHDYGIPSQRAVIAALGYQQAGSAIIFDNTTRNTYEGFSSVAGSKLFIANNDIQNTVTSGISVFNSPTMFQGSTARANKIIISNNKLSYVGGGTDIMNVFYPNSGQLSTGHAAIFVGSTDTKNTIINPTTRIQYVTVVDNKVSDCAKNGAYFGQVDNLILFNNLFINNNTSEDSYTGKCVELKDCRDVSVGKNTIKDNRSDPKNSDAAYSLSQVSGNMGQWNIQSRAAKQSEVTASPVQNAGEMQKDAPLSFSSFTLQPTEYKIIRQPFNPGSLADYINLLPPGNNMLRKISYNAFLDTGNGTIVVILRNTGRQALNVPGTGWQVREFYHN